MITFLDFTKFAWEHRSTSIKLEDLYVNPGKSYIYILVPQSDIKKMLDGEDFYGKLGVTKNEPYNRFKDIDKQLIATATGKSEYAYCLCVFEIDFKDQADKAVHAALEKLGCIKSKNDIQYSTSTFGEKPGDDWFINLSFNKIIKSIDSVYKNNKKYFVSDDININGVINYKMPEVYNNNTIIRKMIENIKSDKDDNIVELIYVGFVMSYIKYKNNELSGKTFNEIIDSTILSKHIDKIINSIKNDKFVDDINIKNIISEDLYSKYAELYNKITSIYNNVSNSVTSRLNTLLNGLNKNIFNTDITTFITLLYTDFKFKQYVNNLNIKYTSKIMEYRMTFDLFEYVINEMSRSYNGAKDANFYKTAINNITIFVDSDFMAEMWKTLIHSEYGIYNIIDSINIVNISSNVEKLKNYMEENNKKFDVCLMNPPYNKTLHLMFLQEAKKYSNTVISIQPCEFISRTYRNENYIKTKNDYKDTIGRYLYQLDVIDTNLYFDAKIDNDLGIYVLNETGGFDYDNFYKTYDPRVIAITTFSTGTSIKDKLEKYTNQKYFVPIRKDGIIERWWTLQLINYLDIIVDGKIYSGDYAGLSIVEARQKNPHENQKNYNRDTFGISFKTLNEAINFRDSLKTEAYLFVHALLKKTRSNPLNILPLFNNYINKLSNDDIFNIFEIDNNIRKDIINDMKYFMCKSDLTGNECGQKLKELQNKYFSILLKK